MGAAHSLPSQPPQADETRLHSLPAPASASNQQQYETVGLDGQRITVDIRGAELDDDNAYQVWVRRSNNSPERRPGLQQHVSSVMSGTSGVLQGVLGIAISLLTVGKLYEEIRFIRSLRRELSSLAGSISGLTGPSSPGLPGAFAPGHLSGQAPDNTHIGKAEDTSRGAVGKGAGGTASLADELCASLQGLLLGRGGMLGCMGLGPGGGEAGWEDISGLEAVKQLLQEVTVLPSLRPDLFKGIRQPPRGVLLFGPPGSGKTLLARAVANESRASFFAITGSSVLSMWYGQSEANIRALFEKARQNQPSVIFIGGDGGTTPDRRVTNEFLSFIDGIQTRSSDAQIIVMAATNHPWDLDEAALSRFSRRVYVPLPDRTTRAQLLSSTMEGTPCQVTSQQWLQLADKCGKYSGRDLVVLCREASMKPLRELWGKRLLTRTCNPSHSTSLNTAATSISTSAHVVRAVTSDPSVGADVHSVSGAAVAAGAASSAGAAAAAAGGGDGEAVGGGARGRVVALLARHIQAGRNERRLKKELSQWRRQYGDVVGSWCDVDGVMREAVQRARAMATAVSKPRCAHAMDAGGKEGARGCGGETAGQGRGVGLDGKGGVGLSDRSGVVTAGAGLSQSSDGGEGAVVASAAISIDQKGSMVGQPASAEEAPAEKPSAACNIKQATEANGDAGKQVVPDFAGTASSAAVAADTETATRTTTVALLPSNTPKAVNNSSKGSAIGSPKGVAPVADQGVALTLDQLLALPADQVRAVSLEDFEAALSQIRPSECDMTAAFEEFNSKYGSGTDVKRPGLATHAYMHMYS